MRVANELIDLYAFEPNEGVSVNPVHLHANLDESGKFKDRDVICISGIITTPENWKLINGPWAIALQKHTIPYLHVKQMLQWDRPYAEKRAGWGEAGRDTVLELSGR